MGNGSMIRFIHTAGIHLDSPLHRLEVYEGTPVDEIRNASRRAFENLIEPALIPDAFEESISRADTIADRLRREAERVNRKGTLMTQKEQQEILLSKLERDITTAENDTGTLAAQWHRQ